MKVNALKIRQSFGKILEDLKRLKEPIIIEKGREAVAVLISLEVFKERFIDFREKEKKKELIERFRQSSSKSGKKSIDVLRNLRYGSDS